MEDTFYYDCRWSSETDEKFIDDFNMVQDKCFQGVHTREMFYRQYIDNPYGESVIAVVYQNGFPVASRGLWRNDIDGREAYQPGRTCVLSICRGKGIFTEMTRRSVALLPKNALIYNFPNNYSYPGYIKMGWKDVYELHLRLFMSVKGFVQEHPLIIDENYYNWWLKGRDFEYIKRQGHYFLVKKIKRYAYLVVAQIPETIAIQCTKHKGLHILFYESKKTPPFYLRHLQARHVVAKRYESCYIPKWKIDAI